MTDTTTMTEQMYLQGDRLSVGTFPESAAPKNETFAVDTSAVW
jgi:hypothetical protein